MENWKTVYTTDQLHKAELVRDFLREKIIDAVVMNKKDSAYGIGDIELYVTPEDQNAATELIKKLNIK